MPDRNWPLNMNRLLLPLLFCGLALTINAQALTNGWGLELSPMLADRRLVAADQIGFEEVRAIERQEKSTTGFALGFFYRNRAEKIGTRWGVRYQQTGFDGNRREFPEEEMPEFPFTEIRYRAQIIEVPLWLDFYQNFGQGSSFLFSFGLSLGVHFAQEYETQPFDASLTPLDPIIAEDNYRGFNIAFMTGLGYETQLGSGLILGLQPQFQYWLLGNVVNDEANLNRNLYNVGLRVTLMRIN